MTIDFDDEIDFLFRYRDLVAPTLPEHQKVIDAFGACWWGWWKRPTENARNSVWDTLEAAIKSKGHATIGLFDSGQSVDAASVRRALVTQVIKPSPADHGVLNVPAIPENERELIPQYYRESPFSRAWLRVARFEAQPFPFFGQYSYAEPPPLHGISPTDLSFLKDKVVLDHAELRSMDTTIWHVRPSIQTDTKGRFLSGTRRITNAHSRETITLDSNLILHLTDLHFATGKRRETHYWKYPDEAGSKHTLAEAVAAALNGKKVGLIVITGDLTQIADEEEFDAAYASIFSLLGTLGLGQEHLVVAPGNHDIAWVKGVKYKRDAKVVEAPEAAKHAYRKFYKKLLSHDAHDDLSMARRYVTPHGVALEVCALNSSSLTQGAGYYAGMGRVEPAAFQRVRSELGWDGRATGALRIVALHHHLTATEDVEKPDEYYKGFGIAIDAKSILRDAARCGVQLALHGHRHRPFVWREVVYSLPDATEEHYQLGAVNVLGGGSAGSTEVEANRNYFNVLEVNPSSVNVVMFRAQAGGQFSRMAEWHAPTSLKAGLRLGEWEKKSPSGSTPGT